MKEVTLFPMNIALDFVEDLEDDLTQISGDAKETNYFFPHPAEYHSAPMPYPSMALLPSKNFMSYSHSRCDLSLGIFLQSWRLCLVVCTRSNNNSSSIITFLFTCIQ